MSRRTLEPRAAIGMLEVDGTITLRRMILGHPDPKGFVVLLHGFPETLLAWKEIALALAQDFEVHAFDWPGFGFSSRPSVDRFSYSPRGYARLLKDYLALTGISGSRLVIYATDIGALPALLVALGEPDIARSVIVGDFAPFDRPAYMWPNLQALKSKPAAEQVRAFMNANREEILANTFWRGLPQEARYEISREFRDDAARAWSQGEMTSVDAFAHYYANFTRDQEYFDENVEALATSVRVVWGADDIYIDKRMGIELADRLRTELELLPGIGHYVHLQAPELVIAEIRDAFTRSLADA